MWRNSLPELESQPQYEQLAQHSMTASSRISSSSFQYQQDAQQETQQVAEMPQDSASPPRVRHHAHEVKDDQPSTQQQYPPLRPPQRLSPHSYNGHPPSFASSTAMPLPMFDDLAASGQEPVNVYDEATGEDKNAMATENPLTQPEPELPPPIKEHRRRKLIFNVLRYFLIVVVVGVLLLVPIIVREGDAEVDLSDASAVKKHRKNQAVFWVFVWLLVSWIGFVIFDLIGMILPYLFRFVARYVNPSHQKYWRFLRVLRRPICLFFGIAFAFSAFAGLITFNEDLAINVNKKDENGEINDAGWTFVINDILEQSTIWAAFYGVEKILLLYISIHYHYRGNNNRIMRSKEMMGALITLYEASLSVHPDAPFNSQNPFAGDDAVIRGAVGREYASGRTSATSYLSRFGVSTYGMTSFFGDFLSDDPRSHWLRPASAYGTIERCLANPRTAAALARRIWASLATHGSEVLTADDVAEVLGPFRREEAVAAFKAVGPLGNDVRLDEFVMAVAEAGKVRHDVYRAMCSADHVLNTLDWIMIGTIATVMVLFIMLLYVPSIKEIQQQASVFAVGFSFAAGRVVHHFLIGVVYIFFDHPFDEGDRVEVYNLSSTNKTACVVKRVSLLYTVFRRVDNGADMQIQNQQLVMKRIENLSRSGNNRQLLQLYVDFKTSFTDLVFLRRELEAFVRAPENCRDFLPDVSCSLVGVHELNKLELRCGVTHRGNWGNEKLRSARSNKFHCAVLAVVRKIPLNKPGGPVLMGDPGRPLYTATLTETEAGRLVKAGLETRKAARADFAAAAATEAEQGEGVCEGVVQEAKYNTDAEDVRRDKEKRDRAKAEEAKVAETERVALATLQRVPAHDQEPGLAASSAVQISEFIGRSATGMRIKPGLGGHR